MIPFANIDIEFAKEQLILFLREWYMHPNGQVCSIAFMIYKFEAVSEVKLQYYFISISKFVDSSL